MDEFKKGRDLGTFLRQRVALAFREGENTQVDQTQTRPRPDPGSVLRPRGEPCGVSMGCGVMCGNDVALMGVVLFQLSDPEKCDQMYESLARINSNVYRERVSADLIKAHMPISQC